MFCIIGLVSLCIVLVVISSRLVLFVVSVWVLVFRIVVVLFQLFVVCSVLIWVKFSEWISSFGE